MPLPLFGFSRPLSPCNTFCCLVISFPLQRVGGRAGGRGTDREHRALLAFSNSFCSCLCSFCLAPQWPRVIPLSASGRRKRAKKEEKKKRKKRRPHRAQLHPSPGWNRVISPFCIGTKNDLNMCIDVDWRVWICALAAVFCCCLHLASLTPSLSSPSSFLFQGKT